MYKQSRDFATLIVAALAAITPAFANAAPPDLCDDPVLTVDGDVYEDSTGKTISRWCEPHTDPPTWGGPACCTITDEAYCEPATLAGRCRTGMKFTCDYGEQIGDEIVCYQPGPGMCDLGFCGDYDSSQPDFVVSIWGCCIEAVNDLICTFAGETNNGNPPDTDCGGFFAICNWGQTNLDGTIDCYG
jgi:hypothetical protein